MDELVQSIYQTISDYRTDETSQSSAITLSDISNWIMQFEISDRVPILKELDSIFKQRYFSKHRTKQLLSSLVKSLSKEYEFENERDFLDNTSFIHMQPAGKSQGVLLEMLDNIIKEEHSIGIDQCGSVSKKYSIYIDDVLCTGLTLFNDTIKWSKSEFSTGKTNKEAVEQNLTNLVFVYIFAHSKNYNLKVNQISLTSKAIADNQKIFRAIEVNNSITGNSKIDLIMPIEEDNSSVTEYKNSIIELVDEHTKSYNKVSPEEFYRPSNKPDTETFFTDSENRKTVERAFLNKGIDILKAANVNNKNMRALGYSIPSRKNFGFGALCFTWRNVPNNAPLVFWYSGGGFTPLFKVRRGDSSSIDLNALLLGLG